MVREQIDASTLTEALSESARWGVLPDPKIADALSRSLATLRHLEGALRSVQDSIENAPDVVSGIVDRLAEGEPLENAWIEDATNSMGRQDFCAILRDEIESRIKEARSASTSCRARLANQLTTENHTRQRELKSVYEAFREGSGERPVCSRPPEKTLVRCEDCERVICSVDTGSLAFPLQPDMFSPLTGGRGVVFDRLAGITGNFRCPRCRYRPFKSDRWLLLDTWEYIPVEGAPDGSDQPEDGAPALPLPGGKPQAEDGAPEESVEASAVPETPPEEPATVDNVHLARRLRDEAVLDLHRRGVSQRGIARTLGLPKTTVHDILTRAS